MTSIGTKSVKWWSVSSTKSSITGVSSLDLNNWTSATLGCCVLLGRSFGYGEMSTQPDPIPVFQWIFTCQPEFSCLSRVTRQFRDSTFLRLIACEVG
jgi:hypothetical protein